jgi:hypothetical protein
MVMLIVDVYSPCSFLGFMFTLITGIDVHIDPEVDPKVSR